MRLLGHWCAAADSLEADLLVMPDQPVGVKIHDEGNVAGVARRQYVGGGRASGFLPWYVLDEVRVMMLEHRQQAVLQSVPDVLRLDDSVSLGIEDLLDVVEHCARSAAAPRGVGAEGVQLLRRVAQTPTPVGDLRVGRHHDSVGTTK